MGKNNGKRYREEFRQGAIRLGIYTENKGRYGYRRITTVLHSRGYYINHKTVQRLMNQLESFVG